MAGVSGERQGKYKKIKEAGRAQMVGLSGSDEKEFGFILISRVSS